MVSIKRNDAEKLIKAINSKDECFMRIQLTNGVVLCYNAFIGQHSGKLRTYVTVDNNGLWVSIDKPRVGYCDGQLNIMGDNSDMTIKIRA